MFDYEAINPMLQGESCFLTTEENHVLSGMGLGCRLSCNSHGLPSPITLWAS